MGFCAGPFVLYDNGCWPRNTIFGPKSFCHQKLPPPSPHPQMCGHNDQRDVGIIFSRRCWGRPPAPPLPARRTRRGGGWEMGLRPPPSPLEQSSSPRPSFRHSMHPRACCCVAVLMEGTDNLLPFISQLVDLCIADHSWLIQTRLGAMDIWAPSTNGSSMPQHAAACRSMPQRQILRAVGGGFEACRSMPQRAKIFTWRTFFS